MEASRQPEREARAARNQALFRAVNEKLVQLNEAFAAITGTFTIACECADVSCVDMVEIAPEEYAAVRGEPRTFVVRPGHVYPEGEVVVQETATYVVVEKVDVSADVAELLA